MFVPSPSWQNDYFLYKIAQKDAFSYLFQPPVGLTFTPPLSISCHQ
jgi:hypothetical protein